MPQKPVPQFHTNHFELITTEAGVAGLAQRIQDQPLVAFDLEADSLHHYQPKVCLLQIGAPGITAVIDPLAVPDLSPLAPIFGNPAIRKISHGADYDVRMLKLDFGIEIRNLFDTMIACQFLGEPEVGLASMLFSRYGTELDKRYQKADWSKRPLPPEMLHYAAQDCRFLIPLYQALSAELAALGRLDWVEEESDWVAQAEPDQRDEGPLFVRFKGYGKMDRRSLAILEALLVFRDNAARQRDCPAFKIISNAAISELVEKRPTTDAEFGPLASLPPSLAQRYGRQILQSIHRALELPENRLPERPRGKPYERSPLKAVLMPDLRAWREERSASLDIHPGRLINNSILETIAEQGITDVEALASVPLMRPWQRRVLGPEITALIQDRLRALEPNHSNEAATKGKAPAR